MSKHKTADQKLGVSKEVQPKTQLSKKDAKRPAVTTNQLIKGTNANNQFR